MLLIGVWIAILHQSQLRATLCLGFRVYAGWLKALGRSLVIGKHALGKQRWSSDGPMQHARLHMLLWHDARRQHGFQEEEADEVHISDLTARLPTLLYSYA